MNRRTFLSRSLLSAASFGIGSSLSLRRARPLGFFAADGAAPLPTPYPVLAIFLGGGLDPAMHMVATPNGSVGNVSLANRFPDDSSFRTTSTNIRYASSIIAPAGKADFEPHLGDVALVRALKGYGDHNGKASLWFGDSINENTSYGRLPWASQLTAQFRRRGLVVPRPCAVAYTYGSGSMPYLDLVKWGTESPDPATVSDRILSFSGYFKSVASIDVPPARQAPANALIDALDRSMPSATQPTLTQRFSAANITTNEVLRLVTGGPAWPPPPEVLGAFGIPDLSAVPDEADYAQYEHQFVFAFQALSKGLTHVVALATEEVGGTYWDSHKHHVDNQRARGNLFWPALGKLIAKMKATTSPIDTSKSLFDTTNIWIQSEMGRSPDGQTVVDKDTGEITKDGTDHWEHGSAVFMGGRFKRGIAIGGFTQDWTSMPINPVTGAATDGITLRVNNSIATVMKAAGGDPSEFTKAAPIDAVLDMSL